MYFIVELYITILMRKKYNDFWLLFLCNKKTYLIK